VVVGLPSNLSDLAGESFLELRLVWERGSRRYEWHAVVEDGVDLGEIHPAAVTDGEQGVVFAARALHALSQDTHRRLSELQERLSKQERGARRYRRLMARKSLFLGKQKRRRDIEHKVSRAVVAWAAERGVGVLAVGDVRDAADGVGATNILSRYVAGEVGKVPGPTAPVKYRYPFWVMRSRLDTAQVARQKREAAGL
jgi:hypothetical protein